MLQLQAEALPVMHALHDMQHHCEGMHAAAAS